MKTIGILGNLIEIEAKQLIGTDYCACFNDYVISLQKVNACPLVLPVVNDKKLIDQQLEKVDGLIIAGGSDIDPSLYNEEPKYGLGRVRNDVDEYYITVILKAIEKGVPIIGICKGLQAINVALGGSLIQDIKNDKYLQHDQIRQARFKSHYINIEKDNFLSYLGERVMVNSLHHQAIDKLADSLKIAASSDDGIIEAFYNEEKKIYGVQFHPEMMHDDEVFLKIFEHFLELC